MNTNKYILHSKGENWFHFRTNPNTLLESFSVTYCHDGTIFMSGDMGCLAWQREYFPKNPDYGFPYVETGIDYFAEKVVRADVDQKIHAWDSGNARNDITDALSTYRSEDDMDVLRCVCEELRYGDWVQVQMVDIFDGMFHDIGLEEICEFGMDYTNIFKMRFEMLRSVSDLILESVAGNYTIPTSDIGKVVTIDCSKCDRDVTLPVMDESSAIIIKKTGHNKLFVSPANVERVIE